MPAALSWQRPSNHLGDPRDWRGGPPARACAPLPCYRTFCKSPCCIRPTLGLTARPMRAQGVRDP